ASNKVWAVAKTLPVQPDRAILKGVVPAVLPAKGNALAGTVGSVTVALLVWPSTLMLQVVSVILPVIVIVPLEAKAEPAKTKPNTLNNNVDLLIFIMIVIPFTLFKLVSENGLNQFQLQKKSISSPVYF
ncbi:hypothetical protein ACOKXP_02520, partial [Serratia fonticola]|uniref:hypothetical protein n=1 Tax=Serratia fonticola TaxID=47917 RepID=UPI003B9F1D10